MAEASADDTIEMLKDILYGRKKSDSELAQTEKGSKLWDSIAKEVVNGTGVMHIPYDLQDMSQVILTPMQEEK